MKIFFLTLAVVPLFASAACNPEKDLGSAPSGNLKIFLNYEHPDMDGFGASQFSRPFPTPLPAAMVSHDRSGVPTNDRNTVTYFEPDNKGGWRPCRTEIWWQLEKQEESRVAKRYTATDAYLSKLAASLEVASAMRYQYDTKGRIERVERISFREPTLRATPESCNKYDEKDRLVQWVKSPTLQTCPKGEPAINDDWRKFAYGAREGREEIILDRLHFPRKNEVWGEQWFVKRRDGSHTSFDGNAKAYGKYGVYQMEGWLIGEQDQNQANSALTVEGQKPKVTYIFTKPGTPLTVLENPEEIYNYDRRRVTRFGSASNILEHFTAGSHVSRHRYFMLGQSATRDEQYDEKGKLKRIVTVFDDQPNGAWSEAKLPKSEKIPTGHKVFHRVYDFDAQGKPKLVAMSWNKNFSLKREIALPDAQLIFGTPDGKQVWKSVFEFERHFDTSESGQHVFMEPYDPSEREDPN